MAVKILLGVLLIVLALLLFRVRLRITVADEITLRVEYLFFSFRMNARETGKNKTNAKPKQGGGTVRFLLQNFGAVADFVRRMVRQLSGVARVDRITCDIAVCAGDAAQTALQYGEICAAVFGLSAFAENFVPVRRRTIEIHPDFSGNPQTDGHAFFECVLSGVSVNLAAIVLRNGARLLLSLVHRKKPASAADVRTQSP